MEMILGSQQLSPALAAACQREGVLHSPVVGPGVAVTAAKPLSHHPAQSISCSAPQNTAVTQGHGEGTTKEGSVGAWAQAGALTPHS